MGESAVRPEVPSLLLPSNSTVKIQAGWLEYLAQRQGTYEFRKRRYEEVAEVLIDHGIDDNCILMDFGAGQTEFDYFMRTEVNWRGFMLNVDGALTGENLNYFWPKGMVDYTVCIETIEHMDHPGEVIAKLEGSTAKLMVFTTPNPDAVDVLGMDKTHKQAVPVKDWQAMYYQTKTLNLFGTEDDTILAWKDLTK